MAGLKNADDYSSGERLKGGGLLSIVSLLVGGGAILIFFVLALVFPQEQDGVARTDGMAYSWLFAIVFFLSLGVGGTFWTLLHHASNSGWGTLVRRLMENLGFTIPIVLVLSAPLIIPQVGFRDALWEWFPKREAAIEYAEKKVDGKLLPKYRKQVDDEAAEAQSKVAKVEKEKAAIANITPGHARHFDDKIKALKKKADAKAEKAAKSDEELREILVGKEFKHKEALLYAKKGYLNPNFWYVRYFFYFIVLAGGIFILRTASVKQDKVGGSKIFRDLRGFSCAILLPFAVAWTFLVFDWLMGLDYAWFSTMWGVYLFAGAALNSMGFLILVLSALRKFGYLTSVITKEHYHIMGKLMHAFVIFWAYIAFSQFFLIWYANITEETKFFLTRNTGDWNFYTIGFLVIGHFFVPFLVLLVRAHKTCVPIVCSVAGWNLLMHVADIYWIVIPERAVTLTGGAVVRIPGMWVYDVLAFVGVGGVFIFWLVRSIQSVSLYPCRDPRLDESLNLVN